MNFKANWSVTRTQNLGSKRLIAEVIKSAQTGKARNKFADAKYIQVLLKGENEQLLVQLLVLELKCIRGDEKETWKRCQLWMMG